MAELVLPPILELLFQNLASAAVKKLVFYAGIHSKVKKWETSLLDFRALLNDASRKEITDESVKRWLNRLQHLAYDIEDMLNELAAEAMDRELTEQPRPITSKVRKLIPTCCTTCCTSFSVSFRMHDKINNITTELQDLEKEKVSLGLNVINRGPINMKRNYEPSLPDTHDIVGREGEKEALLCKLLRDETCNPNFNIVPIVGMGGVGKTTLARLLYNETKVQNHFELKAWVCVSDEFDIFKISKSIFESVKGGNKEFADLNLLQVALREQLNEKRFLLVLDDVWSESYGDWENLVRPFHAGAPGSKIIVTTRKEQLLKKLGYDHLNPLQSLSFDDALSLFSQHALGVNNFDSHPMLRPHGEGIVKKCDGLPLALKALGRLLRTKTNEEEWKQLLNSELWRLQKGDGIVPALKLSYHDLDACLKQLFAYCSLFPKDYMFDKEELVLLWMAEGFLHQSTASTATEESLGHEYFEELLSRSFFQHAPNDESLFVMHDLMNDLATSVAGDFFLRSDNETRNDALEKYRHMSLVCEQYMEYKKFKAFEGAKNLRTFLALSVGEIERQLGFFVSNKVLANFLHEFPLLRVLCLSYLEIEEVPESIGSLKHLRYLNLSRTGITHLPEFICNLYNLQTLILFGCRELTNLPKTFSKLKNLRHFDIRDTPSLNEMPLGIGELKSLQTLSKIIIGGDNGIAITDLKDLKNLRGEISIKGLDKVQNATRVQEANLSQMRLTELEVEWSEVFDGSRKETLEEEILNVLEPRKANLKKLGIVCYGGTTFPNWVGHASFEWLTHVSIRGCRKCTSLPPLGQLPSLKELFLEGMDGVKVVGLQLHGNGVAFPSLEILSFEDMRGWEVWSTNRGVVDAVFPHLRKVSIHYCPNLVEVSLEALPSLRVIEISECGHGVLRSLVCVASSVTKLEIRNISGLTYELWRGVMEHLGAVEEVDIKYCNEIRYLWESEAKASKFLPSLRKLEVWRCEKLVSLGEKEEEDNCGSSLTSLRILRVWNCEKMERCNCPNSIETLVVSGCSSIMSVSFPTGGQKLKSLYILNCEKLLENELFINPSKPMLEVVDIRGSSNLKWMMDHLSCFIHLTRLEISDCPSLEAFPDGELRNLTSLKNMKIVKCPSMDTSFPHGLWPPNLCVLDIGGLKKPISEWGPQNFPTSLVTLRLRGRSSEEDVSRCSQLSHLLPSSLTFLGINDFEKLESLSMGLQHLTSLQHLHIWTCPKMIHLPEMLFSGLLSLRISKSPNLEERWSRRGSNWHLISHIPCIDLDKE